ncbi:MAG: hypothetical protein ACPKPY_03715 [Nitrososphaeraceae archaeon]
MINGKIVGGGSDYIVIEKNKKRFLLEIRNENIKELKKSTTPYGSEF